MFSGHLTVSTKSNQFPFRKKSTEYNDLVDWQFYSPVFPVAWLSCLSWHSIPMFFLTLHAVSYYYPGRKRSNAHRNVSTGKGHLITGNNYSVCLKIAKESHFLVGTKSKQPLLRCAKCDCETFSLWRVVCHESVRSVGEVRQVAASLVTWTCMSPNPVSTPDDMVWWWFFEPDFYGTEFSCWTGCAWKRKIRMQCNPSDAKSLDKIFQAMKRQDHQATERTGQSSN